MRCHSRSKSMKGTLSRCGVDDREVLFSMWDIGRDSGGPKRGRGLLKWYHLSYDLGWGCRGC